MWKINYLVNFGSTYIIFFIYGYSGFLGEVGRDGERGYPGLSSPKGGFKKYII